MTTDGDRSKTPGAKGGVAEYDLDGHPRPGAVVSRSGARPPDEATSEVPDEQARVILEESEARVAAGAAKAGPDAERGPQLCGADVLGDGGAVGACTRLGGHSGGHAGL